MTQLNSKDLSLVTKNSSHILSLTIDPLWFGEGYSIGDEELSQGGDADLEVKLLLKKSCSFPKTFASQLLKDLFVKKPFSNRQGKVFWSIANSLERVTCLDEGTKRHLDGADLLVESLCYLRMSCPHLCEISERTPTHANCKLLVPKAQTLSIRRKMETGEIKC